MLAPWPIGDKRTCRSDLYNNAPLKFLDGYLIAGPQGSFLDCGCLDVHPRRLECSVKVCLVKRDRNPLTLRDIKFVGLVTSPAWCFCPPLLYAGDAAHRTPKPLFRSLTGGHTLDPCHAKHSVSISEQDDVSWRELAAVGHVTVVTVDLGQVVVVTRVASVLASPGYDDQRPSSSTDSCHFSCSILENEIRYCQVKWNSRVLEAKSLVSRT